MSAVITFFIYIYIYNIRLCLTDPHVSVPYKSKCIHPFVYLVSTQDLGSPSDSTINSLYEGRYIFGIPQDNQSQRKENERRKLRMPLIGLCMREREQHKQM